MNVAEYVLKTLHPKFFNTRPLKHHKDGPENYRSWCAGGFRDKCSFTDVDVEITADGDFTGIVAELGDQAEGRRRYLRIEFKPDTRVSAGQKKHLLDVADSDKVTQIVAVIPAAEHPDSVSNPAYVCAPDALVQWAEFDRTGGLRAFVSETLWKFNKRVRHYHYGGDFTDNVDACQCEGCTMFGREEAIAWKEKHLNSVRPDVISQMRKNEAFKFLQKFEGNPDLLEAIANFAQTLRRTS